MEITLPKGWTTQKITRQKDRRIGQLNGLHENNSPNGWTDRTIEWFARK